MTARQKWKELGQLKTPREPIDLSFWRFVILINWSSDWTWAGLQENGDLKHVVVGITKTQRLNNGSILNAYGLYFFKLSVVFGFA